MEQQGREQREEKTESETPKPELQNITTKPKYHKKMEAPQKYYFHRDCKAFIEFFKNDPEALLEPFDLLGNTAIHIATRSNNPKLLKELLNMLPELDRWRALRKLNVHSSTVAHYLVSCLNDEMVDLLLSYDKKPKLPLPDHEEIAPEEKEPPLLEFRNDIGETPVFRAAKRGNLKVLKQMAKHVIDMGKHFHRGCDQTSILHIAIIGQYFDIAMWLSRVKGIEELAQAKDENGLTCLQLLSRMPSVFQSYISRMEFMEKLIYSLLPEQEYEDFDDDKILPQLRDLENANNIVKEAKVLSRINYATWKFMAKECDGIGRIWNRKKQHNLLEQLVHFLVEKDFSWQNSNHARPRREVVLPIIQPSNVALGKKKAYLEKSQSIEFPIRSSVYIPLLLAASTGIVEIVEKIIERHPQAIFHVSEDEQNVLHVAVKHRQKAIFDLLKRYQEAMNHLSCQMSKSNKGRTLLHQAARMDYYNGGNKTGIVFQLQDELRWFERVKKLVPPPFILFCNDDDLTARELFEIEHADMLKEAQDWIKGTAQSCSAVAVLVTTVVFAAAYTIPGGTDDNGNPKFLNSPWFTFFTIMDIVALASSLISVMMFLSILTSAFEMNDFHKSLPQKLTLGFTLLFFSLATTMLAFGSTILLTIRLEKKKWTSSLIYSATFFPVTLLSLTQFPIYMAVTYRLKRLWKILKKLVPRRNTKSNTWDQ